MLCKFYKQLNFLHDMSLNYKTIDKEKAVKHLLNLSQDEALREYLEAIA